MCSPSSEHSHPASSTPRRMWIPWRRRWRRTWTAGRSDAIRRGPSPSAGLTNLLCNRFEVLTPVVGTDTCDQLLCRQELCGFHNRPLAMNPPRCNGVQPGTLAGQCTDDEATAACALDTLVVGFEPLPDDCTAMPGGIGPDQQHCLLALTDHAFSDPGERVTGDLTHGPPVDKAQQHGVGLREEEPVAGEGLTVRVSLR